MRYVLLLSLVLGGILNSAVFAQNCQTATSIPAGHKKLGGGSATAHYDGTTAVKLKNDNVLGVSYVLTIEPDATPEVPNCTYKAILLPGKSAILFGSLFAEPPVAWKVIVAIGPESDAGVLTYEVYSATK
jgi:hypothetical protein